MHWAVWTDGDGRHTEALVAAAQGGYLHVRYVAPTARELGEQRRVIESRWGAPPSRAATP